MKKLIKIGTRDSQLALWQAKTVQKKLEALGFATQLVPVKSTGDLILDKPLYQLGITGVFTKTLDVALLTKTIDIAVHSMKDVPTVLPQGIVQTAVLERASSLDVLVYKHVPDFSKTCTIATGSLRRKAQWLNQYPHHQVVNLRGNVNSRLQKLATNDWEGAIFAKAGLERIELLPNNHLTLDWMIPAPAQGAMVIVSRADDTNAIQATEQLNHRPSEICTYVERQFLQTLEGGCTAPIGAQATVQQDQSIAFNGVLFSLNGNKKIAVTQTVSVEDYQDFGRHCAEEVLRNGGKKLMKTIHNELQP